jgi:hypothetical protein
LQRSWSDPLLTQSQQAEEFRQLYETFGLFALRRDERLAGVLTIEQKLKSIRDRAWQLQPGKVVGQLDFKCGRH